MKKNILPVSAVIVVFYILTSFTAYANETNLELGDYIVLGHYNDEPIVWRYVLDDENGKLMFSDKILCSKSFDSIEKSYQTPTEGVWRYGYEDRPLIINDSTGEPFTEDEVGSHARFIERMGHIQGNNYWGDSNIRSWLNSSADAGEVKWLCGLAPEEVNFRNESGFLSNGNFSEAERSLIKSVVLETILDQVDSKQANSVNDKGMLTELLPEKVFLLDDEQLRDIIGNNDVLGDYIVKTLKRETDPHPCIWLRQPVTSLVMSGKIPYHGAHLLYLTLNFDKDDISIGITSSFGWGGIRPAFYLNEDGMYIVSGSGTETDPYVLAASPAYEESRVEIRTPHFDVMINGVKYSKDNEYPAIFYNNITYLPMTKEMEGFIGVTINEDSWFKTLKIDQIEVSKGNLEQKQGIQPTVNNAEIVDGFLITDSAPVCNKDQTYPILRFQDILYLPVTWDIAHDTLGWEYSFDENGLDIHTRQ